MSNKEAISFRLTPEAIRLIKRLADKLGVSQAAVMEMAIRKFAEQEGIDRDTDPNHPVSTE